MAEVSVAARAVDFSADDAARFVTAFADARLIRRLPETRPARARVVLGTGVEERLAAANALIDALVLRVPVFAPAEAL